MRNFIEILRRKPKQVRDLYAFFFAFCATGIIAGVWVTSLPARFSPQANTQEQSVSDAGSWWQSLEFLQQDLSQFSSTIRSIKTKTEYSKDDQTASEQSQTKGPSMIDLNALVASSSGASASGSKPIMIATTTNSDPVH